MNRIDRRKMEKNLGITKHKKTRSFSKKMESLRQNIIEGKKKEKEMREVRRLQEQGKEDEINSNRIASIATGLMISKSLSYIDALEEAKKVYEKEKIYVE